MARLVKQIELEVDINDGLPLVSVKSNALSAPSLICYSTLGMPLKVTRARSAFNCATRRPPWFLNMRSVGLLIHYQRSISKSPIRACGMPAEVAAHVFEPFFSTKPNGKGLRTRQCFGSSFGRPGAPLCATPERERVQSFVFGCRSATKRVWKRRRLMAHSRIRTSLAGGFGGR